MIILKPIDRSNYRAMWRLQLKPEQQTFVSPPAWSLARCSVKALGDEYDHRPHPIYAGDEAVGYSTIACNPESDEEYWIDDIMIDARQQGRGFGRKAVAETITMILRYYARCRAIQLTCFRANTVAAALYMSLGFAATGTLEPIFGEPNYKLIAPALDKFR